MYRRHTPRTATILSGDTESDVIDTRDAVLAGFIIDTPLTGATCSLKACATRSGTFRPVKDSDGNVVTIADTNNVDGGAIGLSGAELDALAPFQFFKIVSAGAEGADRTITVVLK